MKEAASPTPGHRNGLGTQRRGGPALPGGPASTRSRERGRCGGKPAAARLRGGPPSRTSNQQHTPRMSVARVAMGSQALDPRGPAARGVRGAPRWTESRQHAPRTSAAQVDLGSQALDPKGPATWSGGPGRTQSRQDTPRTSAAQVDVGSQPLYPRGPMARGGQGGAQMDREPTACSPDECSPGGRGEPSPGP